MKLHATVILTRNGCEIAVAARKASDGTSVYALPSTSVPENMSVNQTARRLLSDMNVGSATALVFAGYHRINATLTVVVYTAKLTGDWPLRGTWIPAPITNSTPKRLSMKIHVNINELFPVFLPVGYDDYVSNNPDNIVLEVDWTNEEVRRYVDVATEFFEFQKGIAVAYSRRRPTLAETRTGTDYCPTCHSEVGTDRFTIADNVDCCATCATRLVGGYENV